MANFCSINKSTHKWDMCSVGLELRDKVKDDKSFRKYQDHKKNCKDNYGLRIK
jgi:hypothetical protein